MDDLLNKIYTNIGSPGGYGGLERLLKEAQKQNPKINNNDVQKFLEKNRTYSLFKERRLNFDRSKIIPAGFLTDLHVDLGDFQSLSKNNDGYNYLLVSVDVLSRRVFTVPVKSKRNQDMVNAFEKIFEEMPYLPQQIFSDRGMEFESKEMKKYFKEKGILKFKGNVGGVKAAFAERMIRTIKSKLYRYFSEKNTTRWIDVTDDVTKAINESVCRSTGLKPIDINEKNAGELWEKLYGNYIKNNILGYTIKKEKFKEGDSVRIARGKHIFEKGYYPNFSDEIFKIKSITNAKPPYYHLVDHEGEPIIGRFYQEELQKVNEEEMTYRIEKVFRKRKMKGKIERLVKFIGYKKLYWIPEDDIL